MNRRLFAAVLLCGSLSATLWAEDEKKIKTADAATAAIVRARATPFLIGPEDILDVQVWKNVELSRTVPVRPDGKVSLPLVNDIQAAGLTATELRDQLTTRLSEFIPSPEVAVIVREVHSVVRLIDPFKCLFANRDRIIVIRQNGERVPFNYRKVVNGSETDNFFVRAGDIIYVP